MTAVSEAFARLMDLHRGMGSPVPDFLNPPADEEALARVSRVFGYPLPPELVELYSITSGVDYERWHAEHGGVPAYLIPGWDFPSLPMAWERTAYLGQVVADLRKSDEFPSDYWRDDWLLVLTKMTTGDEHIVTAADEDPGTLWLLYWEATDVRPLPFGLAGLLDAGVERFEALGARWNPEIPIIEWDYGLSASLGYFP